MEAALQKTDAVALHRRNASFSQIPRDWNIKPLGDVFTFKNGLNKSKSYFGHGTPIVNYMDVFNNPGIKREHIAGLVEVSSTEADNFSARKGDVFFTRTSETLEEIGMGSVLLESIDNAVFSGFVLRGRPQNNTLVDVFKKYCFRSELVRNQIVSKGSYTTRALTNGRILSKVLLPFPSTIAEQQAIAEALGDADALIDGLEKLIAKKRLIKQGAMQELLTGKRRLPGFSGEWSIKRLGDMCKIVTGKKDVNQGNPNGLYPFFTCAKIHTFSDVFSFEGEAILIAGNGEVGNLSYFNGKFEAYQRTYVLQDFSENVDYLWHQLSVHLLSALGIDTIGSSIPYIKKENLLNFSFVSPKQVNEQVAIAEVLSDMDIEISTLEAKLEKARQIKQGMMQELLTGRIRLI